MTFRSTFLALTAAFWVQGALAEDFKLAVTTSFDSSGLAEVLLPQIAADLGLNVQLLVVGTGQALALGKAGDVDAVLVHSKAAEEEFVAAGHATHRREIMYNDYVVIGPVADPAAAANAATAKDAFAAIASAEAAFVSRGDDSGTHKAELKLWNAAGVAPAGGWYKAVGQGMGAALNTAAGLDAYILADRASWLTFGNKAGLGLLFQGDPALFNQYSFLPINPAKHPGVKAEAASRLEAWLAGPDARALIEGYKIEGQTLFVFNAR